MLIPYKFLIPLLVFTLLIGVVIGDRLAAESQGAGGGRSGGCSGLASARLHACVHRLGSWWPERESPRSDHDPGACPDCWLSQRRGNWGCGPEGGGQVED